MADPDINKRSQIEKPYADQALFLKVFRDLPVASLVHRCSDGRIVDVNEAFSDLTKWERDPVIGHTMAELSLAASKGSPNFIEQLEEHQILKNLEADITLNGGELCRVLVSSIPVEMLGEQHAVVTFVDISGKVRAEAALRESEEGYLDLIESSREFICAHDLDGLILWTNRAAIEALGYDPIDYCGKKSFRSLLVPEVADQFDDYMARIRADGFASGIIQVQTAWGERRLWEYYNTLRTVGSDAPVVRGMARDVTEQKKAERALRRSEEDYRQLFQDNPQPMWAYDPETLAFLAVNKAAVTHYGYSSEEFLAMTIKDIRPPEDLPILMQDLVNMPAGFKQTILRRHVKKDGTIMLAEISSHNAAFGGKLARIVQVNDVTERERARDELRKSEEKYRTILENIEDGYFEVDVRGNLTFFNDSLWLIYGYPPDELMAMNFREYMDEKNAEKVHRAFNEVFRTGRSAKGFEWQIRRKDGTRRFVEASVSRLEDPTGRPLGFRGLVRDITRRKEAEEQLRLHMVALESAANAIVITDRDGAIQWANPAFTEVTGYTLDEVLGQNPRILNSGEMDPGFYKTLWDTILSGRPWRGEMVNRRKDGTTYFEEQTITPVLNKEGEVISFIAIKQNITERKRAEDELVKSEERYHDLVENALDIIYTHDFDGNYTSANQAVEDILGFTVEEALTKNLANTVTPEYLDKARQMVADLLAGEKSAVAEIEVFTKDGRRVPMEVNARLVRENGVPIGVQGVARDINARKQLEDQLRQAQKMESIGVLAGGIAHDFNNLLTAINGYSDLTLRNMLADDRLRSNIEEIRNAGERAAALTEQLLAFSRKKILKPKVHNLNPLIIAIENMLRRIIMEDIELRTVLDPDLGNINADPGQIEQVIMNLAVNARDAMPNGGTLTIETQDIYLDQNYASQHLAVSPGRFVRLTVTDTGEGMDETTQRNIFEPFFTTKGVGRGTGLGLSTVYGIVKQSGGNIMVYSEIGHGTTFKIYLPSVDEVIEKSESEVDQGVRNSLGTETILLVEDEAVLRNLACELLTVNGYKVLAAGSGPEALAICDTHLEPIHLLLSDVIMPKMNGPEVKDRIMKVRPDIKVLFMSGYADDAISENGMLDPAIGFIEKPFTSQALARKVREVLDS